MNRPYGISLALTLLLLIAGLTDCRKQNPVNKDTAVFRILIPEPCEIKYTGGYFTFSGKDLIFFTEGLENTARLASEQTGLPHKLNTGRPKRGIILRVENTLPEEGYKMMISRKRITITGGSANGVYYGIQTLRQLITEAAVNSVGIPCAEINDRPRFQWRGLMLDCSRTFQSLNYIRKTIDLISLYKMNVLHLHLTDDQGWRMEIKSHPELTLKGARFHPEYEEPESHQGFYSQDELRELVNYAELRGITIVPEIEMPGHCYAVLACYPELSCTGKIDPGIFPFFKGPGITSDILCAGNDNVFSFIQEIINEVVDVFPSLFIHIGGDEAPKYKWESCGKCQSRIKVEGLGDEKELQSYFIDRVEKMINEKGRRLIGWSEIIEGGLTPNAAVMDWIGGAREATGAGQDVVMSPTSHCYFDYTYEAISTEHAYGFDPVAGLTAEQAKHVLGLQANFWSHIDREPELVDKQLYPRLLSIAERGWSKPDIRDWTWFSKRLEMHYPVLQKMGVNYYREASQLQTSLSK